MNPFTKFVVIFFFGSGIINFLFPPKVDLEFPEKQYAAGGREFYFSESYHKTYGPDPDSPDPTARQTTGIYRVHWTKLAITQFVLFFGCGFLVCYSELSFIVPPETDDQSQTPQTDTARDPAISQIETPTKS